ncbi:MULTISPECIES: porin [unclassified Dyella]|uniref:OprO/OprP family phosphate-selective porin n=1 Tax=unclassified Dyella TaxID=2634549 RepID=UPI000C84D5E2|nr:MULTISPECIES: porin [unclassified Dyella]MDR3446837.1 porin [Dyella sp.]PMQ03126.1 Porin P [Dyella sp. AD56]
MNRSVPANTVSVFRRALVAGALLCAWPMCCLADGYDFYSNWPTHVTASDGTDFGLAVLYQYDVNQFSHDNGKFDDAGTNRRRYFGLYLRKPGVYDAIAQYDFQAKQWADAFVRFRSSGVIGEDVGNFRFGYSKTPVGFEGVTSSSATTFIETALPTQAVWEGRRAGFDWALVRPHFIINIGDYFWRKDFDGNNPGRTWAGRAAWMPLNAPGKVLHLGVSASREKLDWADDGTVPPSARLRARPEDGLSPVRLVDSGNLPYSKSVNRQGFESLWIEGPWSLQGEYLKAQVDRYHGKPDYDASGFYVFTTWTLTGESRAYSDGNVADRRYNGRDLQAVRPTHAWGAVELAVRYSELDLNDGSITGGKEHDWTAGANWYLGEHLKLQTNYVWAFSDRGNLKVDPHIFEVRAQVYF